MAGMSAIAERDRLFFKLAPALSFPCGQQLVLSSEHRRPFGVPLDPALPVGFSNDQFVPQAGFVNLTALPAAAVGKKHMGDVSAGW